MFRKKLKVSLNNEPRKVLKSKLKTSANIIINLARKRGQKDLANNIKKNLSGLLKQIDDMDKKQIERWVDSL